jgi:hypothetical protein
MLATCAFWALLLLPGLAVVQRFAPAELERGLLSAVALGYAASFLLLSPCSVLCYVCELPVWVFSATVAASVVLGALALGRASVLRALGRAFAPDLGPAALLLAVHLVMAARLGGWLDGDATYHVGRIRDLLDHGMNNRDIYLAEPHFSPAYHTNLLHALYAAATQLGTRDPLLVWFASLPWAKLVIAAGHYHLAHVVLRKRWAAWLVVLGVCASRAGETYSLYPNLIAVGWLAPTLLGAAFGALEPTAERGRSMLYVALGSFLLAEVHALYWAIACVALGPLFALHSVHSILARRAEGSNGGSRARFFGLCALALLAGAPFSLVGRFGGRPSEQQEQAAKAAVTLPFASPESSKPLTGKSAELHPDDERAAGGHLEKELERRADGRLGLRVADAGGASFLLLGFGALAGCVLWRGAAREPMLALGSAAVMLAAIPLQPSLATLASLAMPQFGVARMITLASSLLLVAIGGLLANVVDRFAGSTGVRLAVTALATAAATQLPAQAPRSFSAHVQSVLAGPGERLQLLNEHWARRELLRAHVPAGERILATLREGRYAVMLHDVHVVAADRGDGQVPSIAVLRRHVIVMTEARTPWPERAALLQHYGLRFVLYRDKHVSRFRWALQHGRLLGAAGGLQLAQLTTSP